MSSHNNPVPITKRLNDLKQKIIDQAVSDRAFREKLWADPKAVLADQFGVPEDAIKDTEIRIVEVKKEILTLPIPPAMGDLELSDEDLTNVVGGAEDGNGNSWYPSWIPEFVKSAAGMCS